MTRSVRPLVSLLCLSLLCLSSHVAVAAEADVLAKAARGEKLTEDEFSTARTALVRTARVGRPETPEMQTLLQALVKAPAAKIGPDRGTRLKVLEQPLVALRMVYEAELAAERMPVDQLRKHPSADLFPGPVPSSAKLETLSCTIDANGFRWMSTGFYAPPGETIRVTIPNRFANRGWKVRIGASSTRIDIPRHTTVNRFIRVDRQFDLVAPSIEVASSFGGLIYIELPSPKSPYFLEKKSDIYNVVGDYSPPAPLPARVKFTNVVRAPRYVHGVTDPQEWRAVIRHHPAPYAEIGSEKIIFMLPSQFIRELDTPDLTMQKWDRVVDAMSELSGRPTKKPFPIRFLIDAHVNWGAAFAGYPINAPYSWAKEVVSGDAGWGHLHEIGHLHQHPTWTYQGTGEVTVNIFTLYAFEKVFGNTTERRSKEFIFPQIREYLSRSPAEKDWTTVKGALFERLAFYTVLAEEFGWEPFRKVFRDYRELPLDRHPKDDVDRASHFLVRMSQATGRNLGPYFTRWGVQVHPAALQQVSGLPEWKSKLIEEALSTGN